MDWFARRGIRRTDEEVMLLDTPDIRQDADHDCGVAAASCALRHDGREVGSNVSNPVQGASPDTVEAMLRRAGAAVTSGEMLVEDLKHYTKTGRPVLCPVSLYGGHWVTVRGVERGKVHYQCPVNGREAVPLARWLEVWRDQTTRGTPYVCWGIAVG
jgi:ABC-type bacteriocin/lantibiotic exporter with double-glycine peptidase domain